jgi:hypothetical protein
MRPGTGSTVVIQTDRRGRPAHLPARPVLRCRAARVLSAPRGAVKIGRACAGRVTRPAG